MTTGAAIYADGRLYVLDEEGTVALLKPGPGRLDIVSRFRVTTERVHDAWAHPVLYDGRLYLRYNATFWCYDVKDHRKRLWLARRVGLAPPDVCGRRIGGASPTLQ